MKIAINRFFVALCLFSVGIFSEIQPSEIVAQEIPAALNFQMKSIQGEDVSLTKYAGKVVVFVNVASKCGFTPQYKQLQALHAEYADKGVAVVGVPCNQFRGQEPGTEEEIAKFCKVNYGVEFDLMSKVNVKGDEQTPLYKHLTELDLAPVGKGPIKWNFEKIVLDKSGKPVARFGSRVSPDSDEFMAVIKSALGDGAAAVAVEPYSHESKKLGKKYYLFGTTSQLKNSDEKRTVYFFAGDPVRPEGKKGEPVAEVPEGKVVAETKTGMLVLKNKK